MRLELLKVARLKKAEDFMAFIKALKRNELEIISREMYIHSKVVNPNIDYILAKESHRQDLLIAVCYTLRTYLHNSFGYYDLLRDKSTEYLKELRATQHELKIHGRYDGFKLLTSLIEERSPCSKILLQQLVKTHRKELVEETKKYLKRNEKMYLYKYLTDTKVETLLKLLALPNMNNDFKHAEAMAIYNSVTAAKLDLSNYFDKLLK